MNTISSGVRASCHAHQDYASRMGNHEAGNGGESRNYLSSAQAAAAMDVGFWRVLPCDAG